MIIIMVYILGVLSLAFLKEFNKKAYTKIINPTLIALVAFLLVALLGEVL